MKFMKLYIFGANNVRKCFDDTRIDPYLSVLLVYTGLSGGYENQYKSGSCLSWRIDHFETAPFL